MEFFMKKGRQPKNPRDSVTMIGLDFGSTTSSAMVARAAVGLNTCTGRMTLGSPQITYRSDLVLTPFDNDHIEKRQLSCYLDQWIAESALHQENIFAGGAIITGLAAKKINSDIIARLVRERIGEAIVATANDPRFESWLAFMGSCFTLSRSNPETAIINIDIGGGTTNPALGINGDVIATGCFFIGARHFRIEPGSYRLTGISFYGEQLLKYLEINKTIGDSLESPETDAVLDFYVAALEAIVVGDIDFFTSGIPRLHQQVPFRLGQDISEVVICFSGGVGELIYGLSRGNDFPKTTFYGDLGIDLALRILRSPRLSAHVRILIPENMGRATVYGLAVHSTEVSGMTIFVSDPSILPCHDLPVVARLTLDADREDIANGISLVLTAQEGGCIQIVENGRPSLQRNSDDRQVPVDLARVKEFATRMAENWTGLNRLYDQPIVLLVPGDYGHVLGNYVSDWGRLRLKLIVIDEIPDRNAHFVNIGNMHNNVIPVTFYGVG